MDVVVGQSTEVAVAADEPPNHHLSGAGPDEPIGAFSAEATRRLRFQLLGDLRQSSAAGYQGFGSFHSDNVEVLVHQREDQYVKPPDLPDFAQQFDYQGNGVAPPSHLVMGGSLKASGLFLVDPHWTFVNHGAFGGALVPAMRIKQQYEVHTERQILQFVDRQLLPWLVYSQRRLAAFIGARPGDIALVPNATHGINSAIPTLVLDANDHVVYLDCEYGAVFKCLFHRCQEVGAKLHEIAVNKLLHQRDVFGDDDALTKFIEDHLPPNATVFICDHVTSTTAAMFPVFSHIIPMLKRRGIVKIIIDGAHCPLQYPLDFGSLPEEQRPSFYLGNLHKWFSCPKSAGFIWAHPNWKTQIRGRIVTHGYGNGFASEFIWDGTRDYGAALTLPAIIKFWTEEWQANGWDARLRLRSIEEQQRTHAWMQFQTADAPVSEARAAEEARCALVGDVPPPRSLGATSLALARTRVYCQTLLEDALAMLAKAFGVAPVARHAPFMGLVRLPAAIRPRLMTPKFIQDALHYRFNVEVPVKAVEKKYYLRLTAYMYNDMTDYERLRDAILIIGSVASTMKRSRSDLSATSAVSSHADMTGLSTPAAGQTAVESTPSTNGHHQQQHFADGPQRPVDEDEDDDESRGEGAPPSRRPAAASLSASFAALPASHNGSFTARPHILDVLDISGQPHAHSGSNSAASKFHLPRGQSEGTAIAIASPEAWSPPSAPPPTPSHDIASSAPSGPLPPGTSSWLPPSGHGGGGIEGHCAAPTTEALLSKGEPNGVVNGHGGHPLNGSSPNPPAAVPLLLHPPPPTLFINGKAVDSAALQAANAGGCGGCGLAGLNPSAKVAGFAADGGSSDDDDDEGMGE